MAKPIIMPQVGQDIETGIIIEWRVRKDDPVEKGDIIIVVESEKAVFEIEADATGVILDILSGEGETVNVFATIGYIGKPGETIEETVEAPEKQADSAVTESQETHDDRVNTPPQAHRVSATPSARRVAGEQGIDLATVDGDGPNGRITKADVISAIVSQGGPSVKSGEPSYERHPIVFSQDISPDDIVTELTGSNGIMAERMSYSKMTIPHFYLTADIDMANVVSERNNYNLQTEPRLAINDIILAVTARALASYPRMNSHFILGKFIERKRIMLGFAVARHDILTVPVIPDADKLTLKELSRISHDLIQGNRPQHEKGEQGSFTLSNLSMYPITSVFPIINPPECAILGVGGIQKRPVFSKKYNGVTIREMVTVTLACDHRVIDGEYAARFLKKLKKRFETFSLRDVI